MPDHESAVRIQDARRLRAERSALSCCIRDARRWMAKLAFRLERIEGRAGLGGKQNAGTQTPSAVCDSRVLNRFSTRPGVQFVSLQKGDDPSVSADRARS